MMNIFSYFTTHFTFFIRKESCFVFGSLPTYSSGITCPASPSRMFFFTCIFRLPFSHALVITKDFLRMKIAGWSNNIFSAIVTLFCKFVLWLAVFISPLVVTIKRTVNSIKAFKRRECLFTRRADFVNRMIFIFKSWHNYFLSLSIPFVNINIEIEEKYVKIAIDRLRQEVFQWK